MSRNLLTRSYSPSAITAAVQQPSTLQGLQHINIEQPGYYTDSNNVIHARADPWEPSRVLSILQCLPDVRSITVDMNQIMFRSATTGSETRYHCETGKPENIPQRLGFAVQCTGLCLWTVDEYSKVTIQHSTIRNLLLESKNHINDKQHWKSMIARRDSDPQYKAFDYTADFHSQDICDPDDEYTGPAVDLGLYGAGNYVCGSLSELSMDFASDFLANSAFFSRHPQVWKPDLYQRLREKHGAVSSNLRLEN